MNKRCFALIAVFAMMVGAGIPSADAKDEKKTVAKLEKSTLQLQRDAKKAQKQADKEAVQASVKAEKELKEKTRKEIEAAREPKKGMTKKMPKPRVAKSAFGTK